jgi:hypothetical protein
MSDNPLCERCEEKLRLPNEDFCQDCLDARAEAAWERMMEDGETFRGGEAEAYRAELQSWIQMNLK